MSDFLKYILPVFDRVHGRTPRMARILRAPGVQPKAIAACLHVNIVSSAARRWRSMAANRWLIRFKDCSTVIVL